MSILAEQRREKPAGPVDADTRTNLMVIGILTVAAGLRLFNLGQNGDGNTYYAAAVKSMLMSAKNFFFVSLDPGGFISVDKPPVAFWLQALSARLLGFSGFSTVLPQALAGVVSVYLLFRLVSRRFGTTSGLLAALCLAVTPISVAVDRTNNPDSILVFLLILAADQLDRAIETRRFGPCLLLAFLIGVAFNTKMLAAFIVLPTFLLVYLAKVDLPVGRKLVNLGASAAVMLAVALSWPLAVDFTPKSERPYVGSSQDNSVIGLLIGYNGVGRISGNEGGGMPMGFPMGAMGGGPFGFGGTAGPFRLGNTEMAPQITWLLPLTLLGVFALYRRPKSAETAQVLTWVGWLVSFGLVFSFARGIVHQYYLSALAPAIAALVGIGVVWAIDQRRDGRSAGYLLPVAVLGGAVWQAHVVTQDGYWTSWLVPIILVPSLFSVVCLIWWSNERRWTPALGLAVLGIAPILYALTPVVNPGNNVLPAAGPQLASGQGGMFGPMGSGVDDATIAYLRRERRNERYLVMVGSAMSGASAIILKTGEPVMALGGFGGSDPSRTVAEFAQMVRRGEIRFVLMDGMGMFGGGQNAQIFAWVQKHGKPVSAVNSQLYDLKP